MPCVKLHCGILDSSLWAFSPERELFITALLMAIPHTLEQAEPQLDMEDQPTGFVVPPGEYGFVRAGWVGVVERAKLEVGPETEKAMKHLGESDVWSKSDAFQGRILVRIAGGLIVLNYDAYRKRDYTAAERMRRMRANRKLTEVTRNRRNVATVTQAKAETEENVVCLAKNGVTKGDNLQDLRDRAEAVAGANYRLVRQTMKIARDSPPPPPNLVPRIQDIYNAYPVKVGRPDAFKAIVKATRKFGAVFLLERTQAYAKVCGGDKKFCPNPAIWFNQERFNDDFGT